MKLLLSPALALVFAVGCARCHPTPPPASDSSVTPKPQPPAGDAPSASGDVTLVNGTPAGTTVYIAFGSDSVVLPAGLPALCGDAASGLNCSFPLGARSRATLPTGGAYLNATISFGRPVTCGVTKAELNVNNPKWYGIVDVSLVDGFDVPVSITFDGATYGPPEGALNNEKMLGVFPLGCDLCTARSAGAPCGYKPGTTGCKAGTQYDPKPPCQVQGKTMGGGTPLTVTLHETVSKP